MALQNFVDKLGPVVSAAWLNLVDVFQNTTTAQTTAEAAASVTPTASWYPPGDVRRYGAVGDGSTNDAAAFAKAALVCGTHPMLIPYTTNGYLINTPLVLPANATVLGFGRPLLKTSVNGNHIMSATSVGPVTVDGVRFQGSSSSTVPTNGFGGYSAANTGLLTCAKCTDVRITNCEFNTFYNGVTTEECTRVWVNKCRVSSWQFIGILASVSSDFFIDDNDVVGCTQAGGAVAYGISATGNANGGLTQLANSISFNRIANIPSWDGIMSHDCDGLRVVGNDIRNVRQGIDLGHLVSTNVVKNLTVVGNYIESTTTDTWSGAGASMGGILIAGADSTHRVDGATIYGNILRGFYNITGAVAGGVPGCIVVNHADNVTISGNEVLGVGSLPNSAFGVYCGGTLNRLAITGNNFQGAFPGGCVRLSGATVDVMTVTGNTHNDTTPAANSFFYYTGSTVTGLALGNNSTNSTVPIAGGTSTLTYSGSDMAATASWTAGTITNGSSATTTVAVSGCALGDIVSVSLNLDNQGCTLTGYVSAGGTVTVVLSNTTGASKTFGAGTVTVRVRRQFC